ncbi:MAG: hypothetical protein RLY20_2662 [Verrucomicrobiota bacterium]|jgi:hypothetical protein
MARWVASRMRGQLCKFFIMLVMDGFGQSA